MTAKRFTIKEFSTLDAMASIDVICDNGIELPQSTACDLLNELHEENKQLLQSTQNFLHAKLTDCETLFEQANANSDIIYMKGMLEIGGIQTQLIANIGKRQAYQEVLEFIRKEQME